MQSRRSKPCVVPPARESTCSPDGRIFLMSERPESAHDAFAALRYRDFRLLMIGKMISVVGEQMVGVAIGWELWQRTGSTLALGMVGLVQVVPVFLFALPAGHI